MEKCWICKRTKEEIVNELVQLENANPQRKETLMKEIEFIPAEDSDYPHVRYCSVCDSVLADFILKEGVLTEENPEEEK